MGEIPGPITAEGPTHVPGEKSLTQSFSGPIEDETYLTRGYDTPSKVRCPLIPLCMLTVILAWHLPCTSLCMLPLAPAAASPLLCNALHMLVRETFGVSNLTVSACL